MNFTRLPVFVLSTTTAIAEKEMDITLASSNQKVPTGAERETPVDDQDYKSWTHSENSLISHLFASSIPFTIRNTFLVQS